MERIRSMSGQKRFVFFISDRTGITAEMLGNSLLTQFEGIEFVRETIPFIDTKEKLTAAIERVNTAAVETGQRPIVVSSLVDEDLSDQVRTANALVMDFFHLFIAPMEQELKAESNHAAGRSHGIANSHEYFARMEAVNFTLMHDDGASTKELERAQVILVGVSRCGKTPTSLYLALQFGIRAANFPLTPEDFERGRLPESLMPHLGKLYGLTIAPDRLTQIRQERRPNSKYADLKNCEWETEAAVKLMNRYNITQFDTTVKSIEEIATTILMKGNLQRHVY
jgi:[pyruvate, water dikinase]-phosphate phosphotransferase / [pyruvate, water dikinase] kinase